MLIFHGVYNPCKIEISGSVFWGNGAMADIIARSFDPPKIWVDMGKPSESRQTLAKFNSSPLKIYHPKRKVVLLPTITFQGRAVKLRGWKGWRTSSLFGANGNIQGPVHVAMDVQRLLLTKKHGENMDLLKELFFNNGWCIVSRKFDGKTFLDFFLALRQTWSFENVFFFLGGAEQFYPAIFFFKPYQKTVFFSYLHIVVC